MGIAIAYAFILLTQSTFTIWDFLKIPIMGTGTIEASDFCLLYILITYYFFRGGIKLLDKLDLAIVLVALWIFVSFLFNFLAGETTIALFLRKPLRLALFWLCFPAIRRLDAKTSKYLMISALFMATFTMLIHVFMQLGQNRELISAMYYSISSDDFTYQRYQFFHSPYIRLTPSGQLLSGAMFASIIMIFFIKVSNKIKYYSLAIAAVLGLGLVVNITRSTLIGVAVIAPFLAILNLRKKNMKMLVKSFFLFLGILLFLSSVAIFIPDIKERYFDRFSRIDDTLNVSDLNPRISDNKTAVENIVRSPFFGNGFPALRKYVTNTGGDVHGYLMIGVHGGIPLFFFFGNFVARVWINRFSRVDHYQALALVGFCYILIMWGLVVPGANGPHTLRELAPFLLFSSVLCRKRKKVKKIYHGSQGTSNNPFLLSHNRI